MLDEWEVQLYAIIGTYGTNTDYHHNRVCADYNNYLKIGLNQKFKLSGRRALFAFTWTTLFETLIFILSVRDWLVCFGTSTGHEECLMPWPH